MEPEEKKNNDSGIAVSMELKCRVMADKLIRAMWKLARVSSVNHTKAEMLEAMSEAGKLMHEVKKELIGGS